VDLQNYQPTEVISTRAEARGVNTFWSVANCGYLLPINAVSVYIRLNPQFGACPESGPWFPRSYVVIYFILQWGKKTCDCSICWDWWNCSPSLYMFFQNDYYHDLYPVRSMFNYVLWWVYPRLNQQQQRPIRMSDHPIYFQIVFWFQKMGF
jgi:hypothetical protein